MDQGPANTSMSPASSPPPKFVWTGNFTIPDWVTVKPEYSSAKMKKFARVSEAEALGFVVSDHGVNPCARCVDRRTMCKIKIIAGQVVVCSRCINLGKPCSLDVPTTKEELTRIQNELNESFAERMRDEAAIKAVEDAAAEMEKAELEAQVEAERWGAH